MNNKKITSMSGKEEEKCLSIYSYIYLLLNNQDKIDMRYLVPFK